MTTDNHQLKTIPPGYIVYIMTNEERTVFYTGVTGYLSRKLSQHAAGTGYEYGNGAIATCRNLVYVESYEQAVEALQREEKIRLWSYAKISSLIKTGNPEFKSLNGEIVTEGYLLRR